MRRGTGARWLAGLCLASFTLIGCSNGPLDAASESRHAAAASPSEGGARFSADARACNDAETVIRHISVDTARWVPDRNPFDRAIARRLSTRASDLGAQGPHATDPQIRAAVGSTAKAFTEVAEAMRSRKRARLDHAIAVTRTTYKGLKHVCSFGEN
ncbi:MAG: hypothetical protein JWR85_1576 [Marmoricola sp.]|nr:hypothetical protein [Marmoricola sp.]